MIGRFNKNTFGILHNIFSPTFYINIVPFMDVSQEIDDMPSYILLVGINHTNK